MYRSFQGLLLMGLFVFFASKAVNGQLTWYINSRFIPLILFGTLFLAILAQTIFSEIKRLRKHNKELDHTPEHDHSHASPANLWFMLIPLLIGILIPARPLNSTAFETKGLNTSAPMVSSDTSSLIFETESEKRNILDWLKLFNYEDDVTQFIGQKASVIGFVYFDKSLGPDQFYVSRFVVSCCAADGFAIAIPAHWPDAASLKKDSWVIVKGTISSVEIDGNRMPLITAATVEPVDVPDQPYLFP